MVGLGSFGRRLKAARERAGITQEDLAARLDRHKFTVAKWEQELHPPKKAGDYDELAYHLNCSVVWLRDGVGEMGSKYTPDPNAPDVVARRAVRRLPRTAYAGPPVAAGVAEPALREPDLWVTVADCVVMLIEAKPIGLSATDLARALPVLYAIARRSPEACDAAMATQVLQAMQ